MRTLLVASLMVLAFTLVAAATVNPQMPPDPIAPVAGDPPSLTPGVHRPGHVGGDNLVALIGETVTVASSWRDMMHNATVPRMVAVSPFNDADQRQIFVVYTGCTSPTATSLAHVAKIDVTAQGGLQFDDSTPRQISNGPNFSAYNSVYMTTYDGTIATNLHTYHSANGDDYNTYLAYPNLFIPWFYNYWQLPEVNNVTTMWPFGELGAGDGPETYNIHTILNEYDPDNLFEDGIYYARNEWDEITGSMLNTTPGNQNQALISEDAINLSACVAVNEDGARVALGQTLSRFATMGESDQSQFNADLHVWESTDGGESWDFGTSNSTNITSFLPPDFDLLPDTMAANRDTLRCRSEVEIIYDDDNTLHAAFSVKPYYAIQGEAYRQSRLFYWNSEHQMYTQIADGTWWDGTVQATWEERVGNAQLYKDEDTGILWCAWVQYGEEGDTLATGDPFDVCDGNSIQGFQMKATDVFVAASPNNGLHWTEGVNITNTKNPGTYLEPYETMSEREMSLAHNSDGDYLNLSYLIDYDPGIAVPSGDSPEGEATENDIVFHRVAKQDLLDAFEANGAWMVNYPLHVDSTGFFQSTDEWEWNGFFNPDGGGEPTYGMLELDGINTIVGPDGGTVAYSAHLETYVNQSFQDVDYWVTVTFPSGQVFGPFNEQTYNIPALADITLPYLEQAIPGGIPGGTYTYTAHLGIYPVSILDDGFEFTKLGAVADGTFDPADWPTASPLPEAAADGDADLTAFTPGSFALDAAWPNPFNAATSISFSLPLQDWVSVTVYDLLGREVMTLAEGKMVGGRHQFTMDGSTLSSGVYFLTVRTRSFGTHVQKLALVK